MDLLKHKYSTPLILTAIVLLALALRLYHLNFQSLWVDEIASMNGADPDQSWSWVINYSVSDQPPAFFLLLHGWLKLLPYNDFSGRLLSVLIGTTGVVTAFFLGREVRNDEVGLTAATITTFSFIHILFSQEVRFYTLVFFATCLSYLFFIRAIKTSRFINFVFYAIFTSLVIYTHYFGLVVLLTQGILSLVILIFYRFSVRFILYSIGSAIAIVVLIIPWIPIFISDAGMKNFWLKSESWYFLINYFYVYFKDFISYFVFGILLIYYIISIIKRSKIDKQIPIVDLVLIGSVSLSFLIPIVYSLIQTPLLQVRYTIIVLPCLIVMISLGFGLIASKIRKIVLIICCCSSLFSLVIVEQHYSKIKKEDWRGMITARIANENPDDLYVSPRAWYCNYYFKSLNSDTRSILPEQRDSKGKPNGIWWLDGFNIPVNKTPEELKLISEGYTEIKTETFNDCRATYYKRVN